MKKSVRISAVLIVMFLIQPPAIASVKAGSACTKQGVKQISGGKSFTCVKQGKKLVWNKGVAVKKPLAPVVASPQPSANPTPSPSPSATPTPQPSPTAVPVQNEAQWQDPRVGTPCTKEGESIPNQIFLLTCMPASKIVPGSTDNKLYWFQNNPPPGWVSDQPAKASPSPSPSKKKVAFTPWATTFDTEDMTQIALAKTTEYLGTVKPSNAYTLFVDPALPATDRERVLKSIDYVNGAFSNLLQGRVKVFLGTTHQWSASAMRGAGTWAGDPGAPFPCSDGSRDAYCAGPDVALMTFSDIYKPNSTYGWDVGRLSTPAHEMFHTVQFALNGSNIPPSNPTYMPRWIMEGSANYFGFYIVDKLGLGTYQEGRKGQVTTNPGYNTVVPLVQYDNFNSDPYGIGQAASEYLIASVGFENFLNIWKFTKSENSFVQGFRKATGIELSDFYSKFEAARGSMKIGNG